MKTLISLTAASLIIAGWIPATVHAGLTVNGTANGTWGNNAAMSYDASATDPTVVTGTLNQAQFALQAGGSLTQTGGSLTIMNVDGNNWWVDMGVGNFSGAGSDTISSGTQTWNSTNGARFTVAREGTGTLNISGGALYSNAPAAQFTQVGTSTVNLTGGLLSLAASTVTFQDAFSWTRSYFNIGLGSGVFALTNSAVALTFNDDGNGHASYINFLTGSRGQLQINGWSQAQFDALVSSGNIRVNGATAGANQFAYASVGGTGAYYLDYLRTWAANVNYNWDTATANWSGLTWTNGDDAIFGATGTGTVYLGSGVFANSLTFNTAGYTIYGGALTLTGAASVTTNDSWAWISSVISGSNGLVVSGTGTLYLTAANTYSGSTAINAGTLYLSGSSATLGSGSSAVTLANEAGAQLETFWWDGSANVGTSFSIGSLAGGGALGGNVILGAQATMTVGTDNTSTTYAGVISGVSGWGSGGITKTGTGTLTLTAANTCTGTTTISGGTLQIGDGTAGHDGSLASPGIVNNANLVFNLSGTSAYIGTISGTGTTTLKAGTLSVTGTIGIAGTFAPKAGSTLNFGLGGVGASGVIQLSGSYAAPASPAGITISNIYGTWGTGTYSECRLNSGTYNLITGAAGISAGDFVINSVPDGFACTLSASNGTLAVTVVASGAAPTTALGAAATSGSAFSYQIALVSNPTGFGATGLPAGLSLNAGTGVISGTPTTPGTYFTTITSSCAAGSASSQLIIVVPPPPGTPLATGSNSPQVVLDSGTSLTVQPWPDNTLLINPGKGYVDYDDSLPASSIAFTDKYAGVGYKRFQWCDLEPSEGVYNWSLLDSLIAAYAQHGLKFSFGVMNVNNFVPYTTPQWVFESGSNAQTGSVYPAGAVPLAVPDFANPGGPDLIVPSSWADPVYIARMKEFIAALGARYNGDPNVANIQMLNYGVWGERNGAFAAGMTAATDDNLANNYWNPYFQAFPNKQVIVPGNDAFSLSKGAGTFICYIMSGVGDGAECLRFYPNHPAVMEYYGGRQQYYRGSALDELLIWITTGRPSYIPMDEDIYAVNPNAFEMVGNLIGYHYVLQQAVIPKTITANVAFPLSFTWYNDGVAPMTLSGTAPCSVAVALLDADNNPVQKQWLTSSNPKNWMPGVAATENFNVSFPSVPAGYKLAVGLFASQSDANPSFKLGIQGRTSNGWYLLSGTVTRAVAKWSNTSGGSWQTSGNWIGSNFTNGIDVVADFSTLNLTADATVTLDGNVTVGSLVFGDTTPSNNWILNTGTGGALTLRQSSGVPVITVNNQTATISATVMSGYGFTKNGSGTLAISNTNDAIYGNITVNGGVLDITNGQLYNGYAGTAVLTVNSGATLRLATWGSWYIGQNLGLLSGSASSVVINGGTIDMGVASSDYNNRNFTIGALGATLSVSLAGGFWDLGAGAGSLANPSSLTLTGSGGGEIDMAITGTGSLTKNGSGGWSLTGSNSYSGATAINGGTLNLTGSTVTLGSGTSAVTLANVAGAQLETFWWNGTTNVGTSFSIGSLAGGGALGGNVFLGVQATMTVGTDNSSTTYAGVITGFPGWGSGGVTKVGMGTWTLTGANTYEDLTTINGGTLQLGDGTRDGSLASSGIVNNAILVYNLSGASTYIGDIGGTGSLVKSGSGTLALSGSNTYTGSTIVNAGTLIVSSGLGGTASITVASGAALAGVGTISGAVAVGNGATVTPGGQVIFSGTLSLAGGSILNLDLGSVGSGSIQVAGSYLAPSSPVQINISSNQGGFGAGTYNLITGAAGISAGSFVLNSTPAGYGYALSASNGTLSLTVTPPASQPTGLGATGGNGSVALGWTAPVGAASYNVKRSTTSGSAYVTIASGVTGVAYTDYSVSNGTTYYYVVSSVNAAGESPNSTQASALPSSQVALPAPWTKYDVGTATGGTSYYLGGSTFAVKGAGSGIAAKADSFQFAYVTTTSTTFSVTARVTTPPSGSTQVGVMMRSATTAGATMAVVILDLNSGSYRARLGYRTSSGSNMSWATPASSGLSVPQWLRLTRAGTTYKGEVSTDGNTWSTVKSYTNSGILGSGSTVYCGLVVSSSTGSLFLETFDHVAVQGWTPPPDAPSGLSATAASQTQINLSWAAVSGATGYQVLRSGSWSGTYIQTGTSATPGYSDTGLSAGTAYYYMVRVTSSSGTSGNSLVAAGTTLPNVPAAPASLNVTGSNAAVALSWSATSGATGYNVKRSTISGSNYTIIVPNTAATSYSDTGVANWTTYYYVVSALNAGGEGTDSAQAAAQPQSPPISAVETGASSQISISGSSGTLILKSSVAGHTYQLQTIDSLTSGSWTNFGSSQPGTGGNLNFVAPYDNSVPRRFYRIQIRQ
jgi:autotransporter-associated beta strand protein